MYAVNIAESTPQEKWNHIVKCTHETSVEVLGYRNKQTRHNPNPEIKLLSEKQRQLTQINNSNDND